MKARIAMDSAPYAFWPVTTFPTPEELAADLARIDMHPRTRTKILAESVPTVDLPEALLAEYHMISSRYHELNEVFEQIYRRQQGMEPFVTPQVPDYTIKKT